MFVLPCGESGAPNLLKMAYDKKQNASQIKQLNRLIGGLDGRYAALARGLAERGIRARHVYITEYPDPSRDENGQFSRLGFFARDLLRNLSAANWRFLEIHLLQAANDKIERLAAKYNWVFVGGIEASFRRHGYTARRDRWIKTWPESFRQQGDRDGTIHPNLAGHRVIARAVFDAYER